MTEARELCACLCRPDLFQALGDPTRATLLTELVACCGEPRTVGDLASAQSVDLSVVSRHLKNLRQAGLIECRREGREVHCTVRYENLVEALREMADAIEACCPAPERAHPQHHDRVERR